MRFVPLVSVDFESVSIVPIETALRTKPHEAEAVLCDRVDCRLREPFTDRHAFKSQRRLLCVHTMKKDDSEKGNRCVP
jgi:hypothetical protein